MEDEMEEFKKEIKGLEEVTAKFTIRILKEILNDEEIPKLSAKFLWRYYEALKGEGFTDQQAIEIITKAQFPISSPKLPS